MCARCVGLYLAGAAGLLFGLVLPAFGVREPLSLLAGAWSWRTVLALAAAPIVATIVVEWLGLWAVSNAAFGFWFRMPAAVPVPLTEALIASIVACWAGLTEPPQAPSNRIANSETISSN